MGVVSAVGLALAVVTLYSLWGASLLRAQHQAASADPSARVTTSR